MQFKFQAGSEFKQFRYAPLIKGYTLSYVRIFLW